MHLDEIQGWESSEIGIYGRRVEGTGIMVWKSCFRCGCRHQVGWEERGVRRKGVAWQWVQQELTTQPAPGRASGALPSPPLIPLPPTLYRLPPASSLSAPGDDSLHSNVFHCRAVSFGVYQRCCFPSQELLSAFLVLETHQYSTGKAQAARPSLALENKTHVQTIWKTDPPIFMGLLFYRCCQKKYKKDL